MTFNSLRGPPRRPSSYRLAIHTRMEDVRDLIKLAREERQRHLHLDEPCLERGGNSTNHKGVLAQYLDTTIPSGRILLCHACNNEKCSNPKHLYWGTDRDNIVIDGLKFGTWKTPWERTVDKHGLEAATEMNRRPRDYAAGGKANKGKPKSEEHKRKIADSIKKRHASLVERYTLES